jgi:hypothetical protein
MKTIRVTLCAFFTVSAVLVVLHLCSWAGRADLSFDLQNWDFFWFDFFKLILAAPVFAVLAYLVAPKT